MGNQQIFINLIFIPFSNFSVLKIKISNFLSINSKSFLGEAGGALVCQRCSSCDWYILGLAYFGDICTNTDELSHILFTSINRFENWIQKTTKIPITSNKKCSDDSGSGFNRINIQEQRSCFTDEDVEGSFEDWGAWSRCSASCDGGSQIRHRSCVGMKCLGQTKQARRCNTKDCSGEDLKSS